MTKLNFTNTKEYIFSANTDDVRNTLIVISVSCYIGLQILSDIASLKVGVVWGMSIDMGSFIYPFTFTIRDLVHRILNKRATQALVIVAGAINLFMAFYFGWIADVPSDPSWGLGPEFKEVLGPVWRIVVASVVAEIVSELLDTEVYAKLKELYASSSMVNRVIASNFVSAPIDNLIFIAIAFLGVLDYPTLFQVFIASLMVKYALTFVALPLVSLFDSVANHVDESAAVS